MRSKVSSGSDINVDRNDSKDDCTENYAGKPQNDFVESHNTSIPHQACLFASPVTRQLRPVPVRVVRLQLARDQDNPDLAPRIAF